MNVRAAKNLHLWAVAAVTAVSVSVEPPLQAGGYVPFRFATRRPQPTVPVAPAAGTTASTSTGMEPRLLPDSNTERSAILPVAGTQVAATNGNKNNEVMRQLEMLYEKDGKSMPGEMSSPYNQVPLSNGVPGPTQQSQPQYSQPQYTQPQYSQPQYTQPYSPPAQTTPPSGQMVASAQGRRAARQGGGTYQPTPSGYQNQYVPPNSAGQRSSSGYNQGNAAPNQTMRTQPPGPYAQPQPTQYGQPQYAQPQYAQPQYASPQPPPPAQQQAMAVGEPIESKAPPKEEKNAVKLFFRNLMPGAKGSRTKSVQPEYRSDVAPTPPDTPGYAGSGPYAPTSGPGPIFNRPNESLNLPPRITQTTEIASPIIPGLPPLQQMPSLPSAQTSIDPSISSLLLDTSSLSTTTSNIISLPSPDGGNLLSVTPSTPTAVPQQSDILSSLPPLLDEPVPTEGGSVTLPLPSGSPETTSAPSNDDIKFELPARITRDTLLDAFPDMSEEDADDDDDDEDDEDKMEEADPFTGLKLNDEPTGIIRKPNGGATDSTAKAKPAEVDPFAEELRRQGILPSEEESVSPAELTEPTPVAKPGLDVPTFEGITDTSTREKMKKVQERGGMKGLKGFCPVTLHDDRELKDANLNFHSTYRGQKFHFANAEAKEKFDADPGLYAPAAYGADVVALTVDKEVVEGTLDFAAWFKGRLYLFGSEENHDTFVANPVQYATPIGIE